MTTPERSDAVTACTAVGKGIQTFDNMTKQYFQPCSECITLEACEVKEDCFEGYEVMVTPGWDFTQEEEDLHNDPRRA